VSESSAFDPTRHLTKVSGREYLEVKWRLVWLRDIHPDAVIETELVQHQNHNAVFRAKVSLPRMIGKGGEILEPGGSATGWGSEGSDDFGDYLEKAETKALGRALAALGFGTQFCPDYDFGSDRQRVVDSPVDIRSGGDSGQPSNRPSGNQPPAGRGPSGGGGGYGGGGGNRQEATPRQIKYLYAVARELGLSNEELEERSQEGFGCDVASLSRRDISTLIEQIQAGRPAHGLADGGRSFPEGGAASERAVGPDAKPLPNEVDAATDTSTDDEPILGTQIDRLKKVGYERYQLDGTQVEDWVTENFSKPLSALTRREADLLIIDWDKAPA
jgi:hypothetical protein